jgi:hypothetical protein
MGALHSGDRRGRHWSGVHQLSGYWVDPEVEPFKSVGTQEYQIPWVAEYDVVGRSVARNVDPSGPNPSLKNGSVGLPKPPPQKALDT